MSNSSVSACGDKRLPSLTQDQQKKKNPLESNQLLIAVVGWITYNDFLAMKKIMAELHSYGKTDRATQGQSNVKLHPLLTLVMDNNNDVTQVDEGGRTILHHCLWNDMPEAILYSARKMKNDAALVKSLCEIGAPVIAKDRYGDTPLGIALRNNRMDLVEAMMRFNSAEPTDCDNHGNIILHILLKEYNYYNKRKDHNKRLFNTIDELMSRAANLNQPNNEGLTPVHLLAAKPLNCEVLKELIRRGADLKCRTSSGDHFLMLACKNVDIFSDHLETNLQWLLEQDLDVNSKNDAGFTPLHAATQRQNLSLVEALLAVGADLHAVTNDGIYILHLATANFDFRIIHYFIERGVAFDRRDIVHGIKLMFCIPKYVRKDENAVEWLINKGFDRHEDGDLTLLHLVASYGYAGIVEKLLERGGVDVHARGDPFRYAPLHLASMRCQFKAVPELHAVGLNCVEFHRDCLYLSIRQSTCVSILEPGRHKIDHESTVLALLKAGADVNAKDRWGRTSLHYAARHSKENDLIAILLRAGARLDELDLEGLSPLHSSLIYGNDHGLMRLLSFSADINDIEHPRRDICGKIRGLSSLSGSGVKNYLMKLKVAGLPVNDLYEPYLHLEKYQEDCVKYFKEFEELKNQMLTSTVSLYDWLRMNWKRRFVYIDSLPSNVEDMFQYYGTVIQGLRNQAVNRKSLIEPAKTAFQLLTAWQWPDICVDHVLSFLNSRTLRVLIDTTVDF